MALSNSVQFTGSLYVGSHLEVLFQQSRFVPTGLMALDSCAKQLVTPIPPCFRPCVFLLNFIR